MNKNYIQKMLDGVEEQYIEEAADSYKAVSKSSKKHYRKIAVAAAIGLVVAGTGVSVIAAKSPVLQNWVRSFSANSVETELGQGVHITKESEKTEDIPAKSKNPQVYYLVLNHLPKGYQCDGDETYIYYGEKGDTDFFTLAYFHLQTDFTNILPQADGVSEYETDAGTAYIASSKYENRAWIMFHEGSYMMELRDRNKMLSKKEIQHILDGAQLSAEKPSVVYETLEWTKKLQKSYEQVLESYQKRE